MASESIGQKKKKLAKQMVSFHQSDPVKCLVEYLKLSLESKINILIQTSGEEAISLRGEIKLLKELLGILDKDTTPLDVDSVF